MKTQNTQDKATANFEYCDHTNCSCGGSKMELNGLRFVCDHGITLETHIDEHPEISNAINEHAALVAVADAAKMFYEFYFNDLAKNNKGFVGKLAVSDYGAMNDAYCAIQKSLANLAAIQKEGK